MQEFENCQTLKNITFLKRQLPAITCFEGVYGLHCEGVRGNFHHLNITIDNIYMYVDPDTQY